MLKTRISNFRKNIKNYLNSFTKDFINLIIEQRKNIIPIPLYRYNSLDATEHELSSKRNEACLNSAIGKLKGVYSI